MIALVPVLVFASATMANLFDSGIAANDFRVFYTAGDVMLQRDSSVLGDPEAFSDAYDALHSEADPSGGGTFANPPLFAVLLTPFAAMGFGSAITLWSALGVVAATAALWLLGLSPRAVGIGLVLLIASMPGASVLMAGQASFFWLLVLATIYALLKRGATMTAGVVASLLILKPPLAIGLVLWWLIDPLKRRALVSMAVSTTMLVLASWPWLSSAWLAYPANLLSFGDSHRGEPGSISQLSPWAMFDSLPIPATGTAALGGAVAFGGAVVAVLWIHSHRSSLDEAFAAVVVLTLWLSPHVMVHDWSLLVVPLALVVLQAPSHWDRWLIVGLALAAAASLGIVTARVSGPMPGIASLITVPVLASAAVVVARFNVKPAAEPAIAIDLRDAALTDLESNATKTRSLRS